MTKEERMEIIKEAKEMGLDAVVIDGVEYKLGAPLKSRDPVPDLDMTEIYKDLSVLENLTEEDVLYWSTPYYDEIQEKKLKHEQALKERQDG